jgi:hypothetical protein
MERQKTAFVACPFTHRCIYPNIMNSHRRGGARGRMHRDEAMTAPAAITDADGDIAALVYSGRDRPDLVLCAFAEHLAASGRRLCGLVQFRDCLRDGSPGRVMVLDSWQVADVGCKNDPAGTNNCRLDAQWLNLMGAQAKASIRRGVDNVIVNRFGPLEMAGHGFRDAILAAWETDTPLIVAVPEFEFERWIGFSGGMTVRLDCSLDSVLGWWRSVSRTRPSELRAHAHACERYK